MLNGLATKLISEGLLSESDAQEISSLAKSKQSSFVQAAITKNPAYSKQIAEIAAREFSLPLIDIQALCKESMPKDLIQEKLILKHNLIPLAQKGNRLFVGVADPTNIAALEEIKFQTGLTPEPIIVNQADLDSFIESYLSDNDTDLLGDLGDTELEELDLDVVDEKSDSSDEVQGMNDTPIVRFVNKALMDALKVGASDIHFEPYEKSYRIRFRIDGVLTDISKPPKQIGTRLAARLKVMSSMDLSERRIPQDGRIKLKISPKKTMDFRVNTLPTLWGEKVVLRALDPSSAQMGIDMLGYEDEQKKLYLDALHNPQGMILVTGPTGSGKTVSLYTGLNILNTSERNISTAEDPVEINLEGINQVNVNNKVGLDFSSALRSFLRQDPDIIMVGEIRDLETAEIAIKAAQTGHMVMSTLHTNSAPETITRLRNMGVPTYNVATAVSLIIAQRLARRLCTKCKVKASLPNSVLLEAGFSEEEIRAGMEIYEASENGCNSCSNGYKGRVGIYEVVKLTSSISKAILNDANSIELAEIAKAEGFNDLRRSGLNKVKMGLTSITEADRVTSGGH